MRRHTPDRLRPAARAAAVGAALCAALLGAPAAAQDPPATAPPAPPEAELVTDRPDRTESAAVVPPGLVQLESGIDGAREGGGAGSETLALGSTLVRWPR